MMFIFEFQPTNEWLQFQTYQLHNSFLKNMRALWTNFSENVNVIAVKDFLNWGNKVGLESPFKKYISWNLKKLEREKIKA